MADTDKPGPRAPWGPPSRDDTGGREPGGTAGGGIDVPGAAVGSTSVFVADEQSAPVDADRLQRLASFVLGDLRVPPAMELSVLCVDRSTIARLNAHHMGVDGPTDVLAFPMDLPGETRPGEPAILGDVVLCPQVAAAQAPATKIGARDEIDLLCVHGILHLLGHDHAEAEERRAMFALTDRLLAAFRGAEEMSDEHR